MTFGANFLVHWYFHVPNLILAALIYLLLGRLIVALVFGAASDNVLFRLFDIATRPVLKVVGAITPRIVPGAFVIVFAIMWLIAARIALFVGVSATGVRLSMV
jgi:YggT family protein